MHTQCTHTYVRMCVAYTPKALAVHVWGLAPCSQQLQLHHYSDHVCGKMTETDRLNDFG